MTVCMRSLWSVAIALLLVIQTSAWSLAEQPKLGFEGSIVEVPNILGAGKGYRISSVYRGTHAHEPGWSEAIR